jgi:peroxiredoxin Q/BCP
MKARAKTKKTVMSKSPAKSQTKAKVKLKAAPKAKIAPQLKAKPQKKTQAAPKKAAPLQSAPADLNALSVGQNAPLFSAPTETGQMLSLKELRGRTVVLYFYPKDDTPGCTTESCDFRDLSSQFGKKGVVILGVSRDSVESHTKFKKKYSLPFSLISDSDGKITESYGVWKEKSMYGRKYMGIERTTFVIDSQGKILKIYPKVSVTGHADEILKEIATR